MNRVGILRRARTLLAIIEGETTPKEEAAAARLRLDELRAKHKISDIELESLQDRDQRRRLPLQAAAIRCPAMLHDFVGVVMAAAGGGLRPLEEDNALVLARPADLARLQRLAERVIALLIDEAGRRAERAHQNRRPFCANSLWAGIASQLAERLIAPASEGSAGAAPAAARPGQEEPQRDPPAPPPQQPGLVLYVAPPAAELPSKQIVIVNPDDAAAGEVIGASFALDVSGDIAAPAGAEPTAAAPQETAAERLARAARWMRELGLRIEDCPVISLFVGTILGGGKSSHVTNTWCSWLWQQWSDRYRAVHLSSAREVRALLKQLIPSVEPPFGMLYEHRPEALVGWARALAPRLWKLDKDLSAAQEAVAARARAEEEERRRRHGATPGGGIWSNGFVAFDEVFFRPIKRPPPAPPPEVRVSCEPASAPFSPNDIEEELRQHVRERARAAVRYPDELVFQHLRRDKGR